MTVRRIKVGDKLKVTFEGTVTELGAHNGCAVLESASGYGHYVHLPTMVTPEFETYSDVTVGFLGQGYIAGKAYIDADSEVFIRNDNGGWTKADGTQRDHGYAEQPVRLLVPQD